MFRVAVLSFWHVHAHDYASEAQEHSEAELCAVWDEEAQRGRSEASRRGVPFHEDLHERLSCEVIPVAANAGKHVFAEKGISPTLR